MARADEFQEDGIDSVGVSRRSFLGAGTVGGAWLALGSTTAVLTPGIAAGAESLTRGPQSLFIGRLLLELDGKAVALLGNAQGGNTVLSLPDPVVNDTRGALVTANALAVKAILVSPALVDWLSKSLAGQVTTRRVDVVAFAYNDTTGEYRELYRRTLSGARLTQIAYAQSDLTAGLDLEISFDQSAGQWSPIMPWVGLPSPARSPARTMDAQAWVQGLESTVALATGFYWGGQRRRPDGQWIAGPLVITVPASHTNPFEDWMTKVLRRQTGDRPGGIRLYDRDRTKVLASIDFPALGISSIGSTLGGAGLWTVEAARVDLYCRGGAKFNLSGLMM